MKKHQHMHDNSSIKASSREKMTHIKFVSILFDPKRYKNGEQEVNEALADGFEIMRDFETGSGVVLCMAKWKKPVKNETELEIKNEFCEGCCNVV